MAGQNVATGKISLAVELIDNYKTIAAQLKNGLKGNLQDMELEMNFNDKDMAKKAEEELERINKALASSKLKGLDWSNVIPPLTQTLVDDSLADGIKLQILEGFRAGFESMPYYYSSFFTKEGKQWEKLKGGEEIAQQFLQSSIFDEAIQSLGMGKRDTSKFMRQYRDALAQNAEDPVKNIKDITQMISNVMLSNEKEEFKKAIPYMLGSNASYSEIEDLLESARKAPDAFSKPNLERAGGLLERLKFIAKQNPTETSTKNYAKAEKWVQEIVSLITDPSKGGKYSQEQVSGIFTEIQNVVSAASTRRDEIRKNLDSQQYTPKDIPDLLNKLRELAQGEKSKQAENALTRYKTGAGIDLNSLLKVITENEKDETFSEEYRKEQTKILEDLAAQQQDLRSEEKKARDEANRQKRQVEQAFRILTQEYGQTGVNRDLENSMGIGDLEAATEKFDGDLDYLTQQRGEIEKQVDQLQTAKDEIEKEQKAIYKAIVGTYSEKGVNPSKKQLVAKQEAYDKADESNKDVAWIEYYKAYQNMLKDGNMPKKLGQTWDKKSLEERLAKDFGDEGEFTVDNYKKRILNLKKKWIENSKQLEDLLKTISETELDKKAIDNKIAEAIINKDDGEFVQSVEEEDSALPDTLENRKQQLEREINSIKENIDEIKAQRQAIYEYLESLEDDPNAFDPDALFNHENDDIQDWASQLEEDGYEVTIEQLQAYNEDLGRDLERLETEIRERQNQLKNVNDSLNRQKTEIDKVSQEAPSSTPRTEKSATNADQALGESAGQATDAVNGLTEAQHQSAQAGQQAGETAQNAATAMQEETDAANADADAQDRLAASRQNARDAQAPSTPSNPTPAPTPETPPTHPETPVRTGDVKGMNDEADAAENARFKFMSAADAKKAFVDANKDANASAEETAKSIDKESQAAENVKLGFDPEKLQNAIDTTQKIHELLTQVSTAISQMDKNSDSSGIVNQLTKVAEAMGLIVESAQQVGNAISAIQAEGGLKVDLQNGLDINPLIGQFDALNKKVLALVTSLANVQSAIGTIDDNSDVPNLLLQINSLVNSLDTISQKEFGFTFNVGKGNIIAEQTAKNRQTLNQLKEQYDILDKYFQEYYAKTSETVNEAYQGKLVNEFGLDSSGVNYLTRWLENINIATDSDKSMPARIEAYQNMLNALSEYAQKTGADLDQMFAKFNQTPNELVKETQEYSLNASPSKQLEQIFGKDNSAVLDNIANKVQIIINLLNNLNSTLSSLSDGSKLIGLKEVFEQIPQKIEEATQKILELRQQIDTAQFSAGFDEQFKGLTEQLKAAKEETKATNEELTKTKKLLDEETQARKQLQSEVSKHKTQDANDQRKANAEEKKALEAEKKSLEQQLAKERKRNENRTKAVEAQNQAYLNKELERKKAIELEQMKAAERAEQVRQKAIADQAKAQQAAKKAAEKVQIDKEDTSLSADYKRFTADYKELYDASTIEQYNTALQHMLETENRIREAREQSILAHGNAEQIMQQAMGLSDSTLAGDFIDGLEKTKQAQLDALRSIETVRTAFIDNQQSSIENLSEQLQGINTQITPEVVSGWGDAQQAEYQKIINSANLASRAIESFNRIIADMRKGSFDFKDATSMETFLTLKNSIPGLVKEANSLSNTFENNIVDKTKEFTIQLDKTQTKLDGIKSSTDNLIVVTPEAEEILQKTEEHLTKIAEIKKTISDNSLQILNADFNKNTTDYLKQLNGENGKSGIIGEMSDTIKDTQKYQNKVPTYYNQYVSAIKDLFNELGKEASNSRAEIIAQKLELVNQAAEKLTKTTGLKRADLLNGELPINSTQEMEDAQIKARANINASMLSGVEEAQKKFDEFKHDFISLFKDFESNGISSLNTFYSGGTHSEEFEEFSNEINKAYEAYQKLNNEQAKIKEQGGDYFLNTEQAEKYYIIIEQITESLNKINSINENSFGNKKTAASNFSIVDPDEIKKIKATWTSYLRSKPALTGGERDQIQNYINQLQEGMNSLDASNIETQLKRVATGAKEAGHEGETFLTALTQRFKNLGVYLLSFVSFYRIIGVFKDGINIIHELDDALTEMQKVSDESLSSLREYQKSTFDTANQIGTTAQQLQQSTADWMRLGEDLQTASQSAQTANVLFNVSEFDNINEATTALVAMSAAYADAEKDIDKMDIVDRLNLIGNNYAIATDELATALQDSAAALQTAGNDLDEAIALTTAGNLITQDASKTGKGVRTIALRLTGTKEAAEELEEMGEDTSDMIMSQSKMRDLIMNATKVASNNYKGFDIQDELGRYKSTFEIMLGLSQIWDEIRQADLKSGDNRQNLLLESIAGKNRASIASSILQNPDILQSVYQDSSTKAAGSAMEENQKYLESITGHLAKLKNAWQEMWASAANRDVINGVIDLGTGILKLINDVGGLQAAFTTLFSGIIIKGLFSANSLLVKYVQMLTQASSFNGSLFANKDWFGGAKQIGQMIFKTPEQLETNTPISTAELAVDIAQIEATAEAQRQLNAARAEGAAITAQETAITEENTMANGANAASSTEQTVGETEEAAAKIENASETGVLNTQEAINNKLSKQNAISSAAQAKAELAELAAKNAENAAMGLTGAGKLASASDAAMNWSLAYVGGAQAIEGASAGMTAGAAGVVGAFNPVVLLFAALPMVIMGAVTAFNAWNKHQKELIDNAHEATKAWEEQKTSIDNYSQKYKNLSTQLENPNLSDQEQFDIKKQIYDVQKQITDEYGEAAKGIDLVNGRLDDQLNKLKNISTETANIKLAENSEIYKKASEEMEKDRGYRMTVSRNSAVSDQAQSIIDNLDKNLFELEKTPIGMGGVDYVLHFTGDASEAEKELQNLFNTLNAMTEEERKANGLQTLFDSVTNSIQANKKILDTYKEDYNSFLEQSLYANDKGSALFFDYGESIENLNNALIGGNKKDIKDTYEEFEKLKASVNEFAQGDAEKFTPVFEELEKNLNQSALNDYIFKDKMQSAEVRPVLEKIFGTATENKKVSDKVVKQVEEAAENILNEQQKAFDWGVTNEVSPIDNMFSQSRFGNVDMDDRPVIEWSEKRKKQFKDALKSWEYDPEIGSIDTFGGIDIAFTPILKGENGKGEILSKDTVTAYINDLIQQATDSTGNVNEYFLLQLDKRDKKIIAEVGEGAEKVSKLMHFSGKKGAIALAYESLAKSTKETDLSTEKIVKHLKEFGSIYGIDRLFKDMKYDAVDVEEAIRNGGNAIADMAYQYFNIDMNTPDAELQAFIGYLQELGYVTTEISATSSEGTQEIFKEVSRWIQEVDALSSTLAKGQGALTFTKTLDENGNEIESDVSKIIKAYKDLAGYDFYSLFEETTTGIMINADALRELQLEQESLRKSELDKKRSDLMHAYANAADDPARQANLRKEIETLDMLSSAYEGATSTFQKYLAGKNSADYSTDYHMLRDQAIKDAEGYIKRHEAGDEGFIRIANMFTYQDVNEIAAEAREKGEDGANAIYKGYQEGLKNVKPFITKDPLQGMTKWRDYLEQLPKEFGTFEWDENGFFNIEYTDEQLDMMAERLKVSKEVIETLMKELRSVFGYDMHFFKDGTLQEYDALQEKAKGAQKRLEELKNTATDPALKEIDIAPAIDFTVSEINDVDELRSHIEQLQSMIDSGNFTGESLEQLEIVLEACNAQMELLTGQADDFQLNFSLEGIKSGQQTIDNMIEKIKIINDLNANPQVKVKYNLKDDEEIVEWAKQVAGAGENVQRALKLNPTDDYKNIIEQVSAWSEGKTLEMTGTFVGDDEFLRLTQANDIVQVHFEGNIDKVDLSQEALEDTSVTNLSPMDLTVAPQADTTNLTQDIHNVLAEPQTVKVAPDPASVEQTKTEVEQGIAQAEPQVHLAGDPISVAWNGISDHAVNINVGADASEAEATIGEVQEQAEQPLEEPLKIIPENTVQDAANQAGAQQGVTTTKHEQTIQDTQINTTTTADTSALDAAQSKIAAFQSQSGANVVVTVNVVGTEKITDAQTKIAQLIQKAKAKVNVTIGGNNTAFSKSYSDTISKLNEVAKKDTTAKIKGDNSNLKDKVSEAKNKLNSIDNKEVRITASASGFDTITNWKNSVYDKLKDKEIKIKTTYTSSGTKPSTAHGTAHVRGTVMRGGHAYANGLPSQWALKQDEDGALINELGAEIVASKDGTWQILNNGDPTFANLKRGDIVFNHQQTAELLEKGHLKGSHGTIVGGMSAFATGTAKWNGAMSGTAHGGDGKGGGIDYGNSSSSSNSNSNSNKDNKHKDKSKSKDKPSSSNKAAKDFLQTLDAIEIQLQRVDAEISRLDTNAAKAFEKFGDRSKSLTDEIALITKEVNKLNKSLSSGNQQGSATTYANYFAKAKQAAKAAGAKNKDEGADANKKNRPGDELSEYWTKRIKNAVDKGAMLTIDDVHDEGLWKKIQAFQTWYEKGVKLQQKKQEYLNKLAQLTITKLQLVQKSYESYLNLVSEQANTTQQLLEAQSALTKNATINRLDDLISYDEKRIEKLKDEKNDLQKGLDAAVKSGIIKKDSEEYRTWKTNIQKIQTDIRAAENDIVNQTNQKLEYIQSRWESTLELLDADIEKYDNLVIKNEYKQSVIPKIYEKGKKKGQYIPTGVTNDSTLGLYENIINKDKEKLKDLQKEYNSIERYLKQAVKDNIIQKDSETWKQWQSRLKTIRNDIIATENDVVEQVVSQLEYIENKWEAVLGDIEQRVDIFEARQELRTEKGYAASKGYYKKQIEGQQQRRTSLERERDDLRNRLMANLTIKAKIDENGNIVPERDKKGKTITNPNGTIVYGSQDYYDWANKIRGVTESIIETDKAIVKLDNDIRQLDWDAFDRVQEKIDNASEEADFLNSIIDEFDQFNKNGRITARGRASEGLIAQQYDLQMKNAQQYAKMVKNLNKQIANDPNNLDLIEQRDKWLKAQQQSIENAHKQKQAMADLIEKGIKKQIEAMSELIKKYEDMLDAQRSQEQYAKSIADKQKTINSLQKQLTAMGGDDSEEGKVKRQQLQNDLKNAQEDLKDTQEDKRISDIKEALSNMQEKYEEILNARIEDIDKLFTETISVINRNGANIADTIEKIAKEVGYDITTVLEKTYSNVKNTKSDNNKGALVSDTGSNGQFKNAGATTVKNTPEATVKNGTYTENGKKVYYYNGKVVSGLFTTTEGKQRYYDPKSNSLAKGWRTVGKNRYYFNSSGNAVTGLQTLDKSKYYFDENGILKTGTFTVGNKTYTTDKNGVITKTVDVSEKTTPSTKPSKPATPVKPTAPTKPSTPATPSVPAKPTTPPVSPPKTPTPSTPAKITDAPSANYTGLWTDKSGNTYYYIKGKKQTGWKSMKEGKRYFSTKDGKMLIGVNVIGGKTYLFDEKGILRENYTGLFTQKKASNTHPANSSFYFIKSVAQTGWQNMKEGKRYFSVKTGRMIKGLQTIGGASYYLDPNTGVLKTGSFTVSNNKYETDKNGKIIKKNGVAVKGHLAKGAASVRRSGMYQVDERGNEVFINKNGKIYTRLDKGTTVLPHDAAINLLKGMTNPTDFIMKNMDMRPNKNITTNNSTTGNTTNYITFDMSGISNYKEFMREAQRDPNFTKYIQEISLGKLNGNNSLKKNSIRFT